MKLENTIDDQMATPPYCYIKRVAVVAFSLTCAGFWGFGLLSAILTSIVLILSTVFFTFTKEKPQKPVTEEVLIKSDDDRHHHHQEIMTMSSSPPSIEDDDQVLLRDCSESESLDQQSTSDQDSELDWPFRDIVNQSFDCSDGSISDEESLIEIALPSGHYVDHNKEEESQKLNDIQQKLADFLPQTILKQHSLMELLAELNDINEEDNLIEIDISMGSIKCPRFEIEA